MKKNQFSLIEMLTVITVVLVLITLSIPALNSIRGKARTVICANQLKGLGGLISTYANDNDGRLPYSRNRPHYSSKSGSYSYKDKRLGKLYGSWSGHLLPYFNVDLPTWERGRFFHGKARNVKSYALEFDENSFELEKNPAVVSDENHQNWKLLNDMFYEGGYGPLKAFICPEAPRTFNSAYLDKEQYIPRISGLLPDITNGWSQGDSLFGLPSSYLANGELFGKDTVQSKRLEDVNKTNFLLLEGCDQGSSYLSGLCTPSSYIRFFTYTNLYGGSINSIATGFTSIPQDPSSAPKSIGASFFHDNTEEVWYSWRGSLSMSNINQYNNVYNPTSMACFMLDASGYRKGILASNQFPGEKWENYELPFTNNKFNIYRYFSPDQKPGYMFGEMNFLSADLSIKKAHAGWLFENARSLGQDTD